VIVVVANKMFKIVWMMLVFREVYGCVNGEWYEEKLDRAGFGV